jgi:hypothetical protein
MREQLMTLQEKVLESGKIELLAGGSSKDIRLKKTVNINN